MPEDFPLKLTLPCVSNHESPGNGQKTGIPATPATPESPESPVPPENPEPPETPETPEPKAAMLERIHRTLVAIE